MDDPSAGTFLGWAALAVLTALVMATLVRSVRIVPQANVFVVERLGRYHRSLDAGLHGLVPFVDRVRAEVDLREQVIALDAQPLITSDNYVVEIDMIVYVQVTDPVLAVYETAEMSTDAKHLALTLLRDLVGSIDREQTLTSHHQLQGRMRAVLDDTTTKLGIRVNRVELTRIESLAGRSL